MNKRLTIFFDATPLALWAQAEVHRTGIGRMATQSLRALLRREDVQVFLLCPCGMEDALLRFASACDWIAGAELVIADPGAKKRAAFSPGITEDIKRLLRKALAPLPSRLQALVKFLAGVRPFSAYEQDNPSLRRAVLDRMPGKGISAWFSCLQPIPACLCDISNLQKHVVLHDIIPLRLAGKHPSYFACRDLMRQHIAKADRIWANSQFTRQDFLAFFSDAPKDKVHVALHGGGELFTPASAEKIASAREFCRLPAGVPYYASLATLEPRKGLLEVIRAFKRLAAVQGDVYLILAGQRGWDYRNILRECSGHDRIIMPGFVPDSIIPGLLSGCLGFVYMSEYEGFGLPVIEAMSCGAPVLAARTSALVEVAGEAALLVPPGDIDALAAAMTKLHDTPALVRELRCKGQSQARRFSWDLFVEGIVNAMASKALTRR